MKTVSHYLNPKNGKYDHLDLNFGSRHDTSSPLLVNCAGYVNADYNHTNINPAGRLDYYLIYLVSGKINFYIDGKSYPVLSYPASAIFEIATGLEYGEHTVLVYSTDKT